MRAFLFILALLIAAPACLAAPADNIADTLVAAARKQTITPDSLPDDFAHMTRFVRHNGGPMVLFTDGGMTDGYVRHAQAHFATAPAARDPGRIDPLFTVAFEMVQQPDFTFESLAAALEQRLGTPDGSSNQPGAAFRNWHLKQPAGRTLTVAKAQASDNGDPITIVQLTQDR